MLRAAVGQRLEQRGVRAGSRCLKLGLAHPQIVKLRAVEARRVLAQRGIAARGHGVQHPFDHGQHIVERAMRPAQDPRPVARVQVGQPLDRDERSPRLRALHCSAIHLLPPDSPAASRRARLCSLAYSSSFSIGVTRISEAPAARNCSMMSQNSSS